MTTESPSDITAAANNFTHLFGAGTEYISPSYQMTFYKSTNGGATWTTSSVTSSTGDGSAIAVDPINENVIYVGGYFESPESSAVFKSTNGGASWTNITGTIGTWDSIYALAIDPADTNRVYAGTYGGLYRSDNGGASWTKVGTYSATAIVINKNASAEIYIGGYPGVYFSNNRGATWQDFNSGLTDKDVKSLALDPTNNIIYVGTSGGGVFRNSALMTLTLTCGAGGTTSPAAGALFYPADASVQITAVPNANYSFSGWSEDATGTANPLTVVMNSNKSITASFTYIGNYTLTITAGAGGSTTPAPGMMSYTVGTSVQVTAMPNARYRFTGWSGAATGTANPLTVVMNSNKSITANFERSQYTLTLVAGEGGTTSPAPGSRDYDANASVQVAALPNADYEFAGWSGDATGTANPLTLIMNADKSVRANFRRLIYAPSDFAGEKRANRSLLQVEYFNHLTWRSDPDNANIDKHKLYIVDGGTMTLLAEIPVSISEYAHRHVDKAKEYTYALTAVSNEGREGPAAFVTVK